MDMAENRAKIMIPAQMEFHRMNFLVQAAQLMAQQMPEIKRASQKAPSLPSVSKSFVKLTKGLTDRSLKRRKKKKLNNEFDGAQMSLSRTLAQQAKFVAKKAVLRIEPEIKRKICQRCALLLEPGQNCRIRFRREKKSGALFKITTCLACRFFVRHRVDAKHWVASSAQTAEAVL
ncbi:hypothetical protein BV898_01712 [Hypsibius exemplaris]|uniref:Uncharacterized protein n=1 Tax=Hypsibius exemplaris TaxID=2072580 RepID=A0A1W0XAX0_HYPEX|nr:hypothetical protein BV898_01712 [Hypsibius exemplaris]